MSISLVAVGVVEGADQGADSNAVDTIASAGRELVVAWSEAFAARAHFGGWEAVNHAYERRAEASARLVEAVRSAPVEVLGQRAHLIEGALENEGTFWCASNLAECTTPAQRRTMLKLAVAYGHEWQDCVPQVWIDHGIAVWPAGPLGLPGGISPDTTHVTGTGRTRWTVLGDGSVEWEVWRGRRQTSETCDGIRDAATPATPAGRAAMAEWCGMEFRTSPRPESAAPECVLRGVTSPDGEEVVEWRSHLCEERHEGATPYF
jgi:hypothetical protein